MRNNDTPVDCMIVREPGMSIAPKIHLNRFYSVMEEKDISFEECLDLMLSAYKANRCMSDCDTSIVLDWNKAKSKISMRIVSKVNNKEYLRDKVSVDYLDLAIIFTINDDNGDSVITRAIFDHWNITEEELFATAKKNTSADDYYRVEPMVNIIAHMYGIPVEVVKLQLELPDSLYVISTESYQYGATALLNNELLGKISDECGSDLCIIPSSIHDLIVFPDIDDEQNEFVQENISSVNSTLQPEDVLSDRMYRFMRSKRAVTL